MRKYLISSAKKLRTNQTQAEQKIWQVLRMKKTGYKFRRQAVIGRYIVDFVCFEIKLVIEIDGGQHDRNCDDMYRDNWLKSQGFRVLRFWNNDVLGNLEGVFYMINEYIPLPDPPHKGEGNG